MTFTIKRTSNTRRRFATTLASIVCIPQLAFGLNSMPTPPLTSPFATNKMSQAQPMTNSSPTIFWNGTNLHVSQKVAVSPSPDSDKFAIWQTSPANPWFGIYSAKTKNLKLIPLPAGQIWDNARWSYDSSRLVVGNYPNVKNARQQNQIATGITIVDAETGASRVLIHAEGLNGIPFFSRNNQFVYYFHGDIRKEGKTLGANFSLFKINVANSNKTQLTHAPFYSVSAGEESTDGSAVIFSGTQLNRTERGRPDGIHVYSLSTSDISFIKLPIEQISNVRVKKDGTVVFSGTPNWRGPYAAYQFRIGEESKTKQLFQLVWETGDPSRPSRFELTGPSQILHCWADDKITGKTGGDSLQCQLH